MIPLSLVASEKDLVGCQINPANPSCSNFEECFPPGYFAAAERKFRTRKFTTQVTGFSRKLIIESGLVVHFLQSGKNGNYIVALCRDDAPLCSGPAT